MVSTVCSSRNYLLMAETSAWTSEQQHLKEPNSSLFVKTLNLSLACSAFFKRDGVIEYLFSRGIDLSLNVSKYVSYW